MRDNSFFQRAARQTNPSVPVLKPAKYMARRIETGQLEAFAPVWAGPSPSSAPLHSKPQTAIDPVGQKTNQLSNEPSMASAAGPKTLSEGVGLKQETIQNTVIEAGPVRLADFEGRDAGKRGPAGFFPAQTGEQREGGAAKASLLVPSNKNPPQPCEPASLAQAESNSGDSWADFGLRGQPRWQSPVSEFNLRQQAATVLGTATGIVAESQSVPFGPDQKPDQNRLGEADISPEASSANGDIKPIVGRTSPTREPPRRRVQEFETNKTEVRIGALEIAVTTPAVVQAKPAATSSRLSLARGNPRAYGLRQG